MNDTASNVFSAPADNLDRLPAVLCGGALGLYRMAYREWGDPANPRVLVCVHGLTRNSLDFARLGAALAADYRVIAPDVVGRGESDFHPDARQYHPATYAADMLTLLARLDVPQVDWLGTSMGGLIGMLLAGQGNTPIRRLMLNDVGPTLPKEAVARIGQYVGNPYEFTDLASAYAYARLIFAPFGLDNETDWAALLANSFKPTANGGYRFNYDKNIARPFQETTVNADVDLWPVYDRIACPTLLLHGSRSDLLTAETAQAMTTRGPRATLRTIDGVGHAPMLMNAAQIALVRDFLAGG